MSVTRIVEQYDAAGHLAGTATVTIGPNDYAAIPDLVAGGGRVQLQPGTYKMTAGLSFDPTAASIEGPGSGQCTLDFSGLSSGYALTLLGTAQNYHPKLALSGVTVLGPASTSVHGVQYGDSSHFANFTHMRDVRFKNFGVQLDIIDNAWLCQWLGCYFESPQTAFCRVGSSGTNVGEELTFIGGAVLAAPQDSLVVDNGGVAMTMYGFSFDYSGRAINLTRGAVDCFGCHFEGDDGRVATGANEYIYVGDSGSGVGPSLVIVAGSIVPKFPGRQAVITVGGSGLAKLAVLARPRVFTGTGYAPSVFVQDIGSAASQHVVVSDPEFTAAGLTVPTTAVNFEFGMTSGGDFRVGRPTGSARSVVIGASVGQSKNINFRSADVDRWIVRSNNTAESGSNVGSDFEISARSDAGSNIAVALSIVRASGLVQVNNGLKVTGNIDTVSLPTADPHVAGRLWSSGGALTVSAG